MLKSKITIHLEHHRALRRVLDGAAGRETSEILEYWSTTYRSFVLLRFDIFSAGGGNWRRNATATRRRKGHDRILEDTREMRLELAEGISEVDRDKLSVTMGFTNEAAHSRSQLNIAQLATVHDKGLGTVPRRRILVLPDDRVLRTLRGGTSKRMVDIANGV